MKTITRPHKTILLAALLILGTSIFAPGNLRAGSDQVDLDALFRMLETHSWDQPYDALMALDTMVIRSMTDEPVRKELEERFILILTGSTNPFALQYACRQLYLIGTARSVPAIAAWLPDEELSHMARYALANIGDPSATEALNDALGKSSGEVKAGIIHDLAKRNNASSVHTFVTLSGDSDETVALAAIRALGATGNRMHLPLLEEKGEQSPLFYTESSNAILAITARMMAEGRSAESGAQYRKLYEHGLTANVRMAGLKGMMESGDANSEQLLIQALSGQDHEIRGFAGRLIADPTYQIRETRLTGSLRKLPKEGKIVLMDALGARNASASKPAILEFGDDPDEEIVMAVIRATGHLGNAGDIPFLAGKAAGKSRQVSAAAQVSLSQLRGDNINGGIESLITDSPPEVQAALIRSLTNRNAQEVKNHLLPHLDSRDTGVRKAVLEYLRQNGDEGDLQLLIGFINRTGNRQEITLASRAIKAICTTGGARCETVIIENLNQAGADLKEILIENLNLVQTGKALEQCIRHTRDSDPEISRTAVRTLAAWQDSTAMEELKEIMYNNPDQSQRILALRGYFRLFRSTGLNNEEKMREYGRLIERAAERKEEKVLVLSAFQEIGTIDAMKRIEKYLYDQEMSHETCIAILRITDFLDSRYKTDIAVAMMQIQQVSGDENVLADVERRFTKFGIDPALYFDPPGTKKGPAEKRILLISGPMDHAWYGAHEYPKDLLFLKKCMENSPDMAGVRIDFCMTEDLPNLDLIEGATTIVAHSSADRAAWEVHSLFPNYREEMVYTPREKAFYERLDSMVSQGMGVVILHYSVWTDFPESREYMSRWVGGYYDDAISKVRMDSAMVKLEAPRHPVNRGVSPWHLMEEYYINQVYHKKGLKFTPLIAAELPLNRGDDLAFHTFGWAVERRDGGRGIGFTGCHTHAHLYNDDYRTFVVNSIAWATGLEIPKGGIRTEVPEGWDQ